MATDDNSKLTLVEFAEKFFDQNPHPYQKELLAMLESGKDIKVCILPRHYGKSTFNKMVKAYVDYAASLIKST